MALVRVRDNETNEITYVGEEWLVRWPDDFTPVTDDADPADSEPTLDDAPATSNKPSRRR